jgi:hypothetical protein
MENLQEKYKKFFGGVCYAFCLVKKFKPEASDAEIAKITLDGWDFGFIDDDGYVSMPVEFINECILDGHKVVRDVEKVDFSIHSLEDKENIVMFQYNDGTHFVIMNQAGDITFDPSGNSNSAKYGIPVSIRKFITR